MKKTTTAIVILGFFLVIFLFHEGIAFDKYEKMPEGKNFVEINLTISVKDFVKLNPSIEYITYRDEFLNMSVSYVNVFGGIGDNFDIRPGVVYELSLREDSILILDDPK